MALVVETGAGVPGANSFVTDAEFMAWASARGRVPTQESGSERAPYIVLAADYLNNEQRFEWRGTRNTGEQTLVYPRTGVVDRDGIAWGSTVVPWRLKYAQCALAWYAMTGTDLQPVLSRGGRIQSKTVGPLSTTFFDDAPAESTVTEALGLIEPLLLVSGRYRGLRAKPTISPEVAVDGFEGEYAPENVSP